MTWVVNDTFFNVNGHLKYMGAFTYNIQIRWISESYVTSFRKIAFSNEIKLDLIEKLFHSLFLLYLNGNGGFFWWIYLNQTNDSTE